MKWPWQKDKDPYNLSSLPEVKKISRRPLLILLMGLFSVLILMTHFAAESKRERREQYKREIPTPPMITADELRALAERDRRRKELKEALEKSQREAEAPEVEPEASAAFRRPGPPVRFGRRPPSEPGTRSLAPAGFDNRAGLAEAPAPPPDPTQELLRAIVEAQRPAVPAVEERSPVRAIASANTGRSEAPTYTPKRARLYSAPSRYLLQAGSYVGLVLESHVHSEIPGQVVARIAHDVYDSLTARHLLIPAGSRVVGRLEGGARAGDRRVQIAWERLQYPDGRTLMLGPLPTADRRGASGVEDRANQHWGRLYKHAFLTSLVSAAGQLSQPQRSADGFQAASPGQEVAGQIGRDLSRVTERVLERNLAVEPTLEIRPGTMLHLVVTEDVFFSGALRPRS